MSFYDVHGCNRGGTLPFGIPQGPVVLRLSRKSSAYFLAGGYVRDTWPPVSLTKFTNTKNDNTRIMQAELSRTMAELTMAVRRLGIRFKWILAVGFKIFHTQLCCYWMGIGAMPEIMHLWPKSFKLRKEIMKLYTRQWFGI